METWLTDVRHALRSLLRQPSFTLASSATLAIGIGGVAAMAALVQTVLLAPPPWTEPAELVTIREHGIGREKHRLPGSVNPANLLLWRDRTKAFADIAGFATGDENLGLGTDATEAKIAFVTGNFFDVLQLRPALGRPFSLADSRPGAADLVILSHGLWQRSFGGDPGVIGRKVLLGGLPTEVVGVVAAEREFPTDADAWVPLAITEEMRTRRGRWMTGIGRLKPGVSLEQGHADLAGIAAALAREFPDRNTNMTVATRGLHDELVGEMRPALLLLSGAAAFVLLVACANVANLLLVRGVARRREMAMRAALGASRSRLVRLLLVDAVVLSVTGAAGAWIVARVFVEGLLRLAPGQLPAFLHIEPDLTSMAVASFVGTVVMVVAALAPSYQASRLELAPVLRDGGGAGMGRERRRLGRVFVAFEVALACLLLAATGLLVRSLDRLVNVDKGFETAQVTTFKIRLPSTEAYDAPAASTAFFDTLLQKVRAVPGVTNAGALSWRPLGPGSLHSFQPLDRPRAAMGDEPSADVRFVTPGVFDTLGIRMIRGRDFTPQDAAGAPTVAIVNRRLAESTWPGQDPIGKRIGMEWNGEFEGEVVGVVGDVRLGALDKEAGATMYWSQAQVPGGQMTYVVQSPRPMASLEPELRRAIASLDPGIAMIDAEPLDRTLWDSVARPVFTTSVATAFSALALLLAAIGLFGVMARFVGDRRPELAVRLALGARPSDVVHIVMREALTLALPGALIGLGGALAVGGLLRSQLFGTSPSEPLVHLGAAAIVLAVALGTALLPAVRAGRVAPAAVLRSE